MLGFGFGLTLGKGGGPPPSPPSGPIARWRFDTADVSGASVADFSGNGRTGTLVGSPPLVAGLVGDQAISVVNNITNLGTPAVQYMSAPFTGQPLPNFSVTFWAKNVFLPNLSVSTFVGIGKVNGPMGLRIVYNKFTNVGWLIEIAIPLNPVRARYGAAGLAPNGTGTHFYAATWDSTIPINCRFFRDAVEASLTASQNLGIGVAPNLVGPDTLWVGASVNGAIANGPYDGAKAIIDDPRVYDRVLTPQQITDIFNGA